MKRTHGFVLAALLLAFCLLSPAFGHAAEDRDMVLEGLDGDVTTNEYQSFIDKLNFLPPPPTNNLGNLMVDEKDGARLHGLQTFYSFTHDRRVLDMAVLWSDAFLRARNDPTNGRIMWGPANAISAGPTKRPTRSRPCTPARKTATSSNTSSIRRD